MDLAANLSGAKGAVSQAFREFKNSHHHPGSLSIMKRRNPPGGFSLAELVIVLALIGIIAAIAVPSLQRYAVNGDLRTAARDLMADFALAKQRAMSENMNYSISFSLGDNQYTISSGINNQTKSLAGFGANIQGLNFGGNTVTFQTRGILEPGGNLTLRNIRGSTATITWNIAGRAYVEFNMQ